MLVDEQNGDVLSMLGEVVKRFLDRARLRVVVAYEEITLRIWGICDMLNTCGLLVHITCLVMSELYRPGDNDLIL